MTLPSSAHTYYVLYAYYIYYKIILLYTAHFVIILMHCIRYFYTGLGQINYYKILYQITRSELQNIRKYLYSYATLKIDTHTRVNTSSGETIYTIQTFK